MKQATYFPAVFIVATATAKPRIATLRPAVMCHVRSCSLPDDQPMSKPPAPASKNGGQVMTSVIVVEKPRVLTTLLGLVEVTKERVCNIRREETVEGTSRKMEALHEYKDPGFRIFAGLLETFHSRYIRIAHGNVIANHSRVSKLSFLLRQPSGGLGGIRE